MSKVKELRIKLDAELYDKLKEKADKKGLSMKDYLLPVLEALVKKESVDFIKKPPKTAVISLKYPTRCLRCGRELKETELAYWVEGVGVYCLDCYYSHFDKSLAKMYLRKRELERVIKELKKQADSLADFIIEHRKLSELKRVYDEGIKAVQTLRWLVSRFKEDTELINKLLEVEAELREIKSKLLTIEKFLLTKKEKAVHKVLTTE